MRATVSTSMWARINSCSQSRLRSRRSHLSLRCRRQSKSSVRTEPRDWTRFVYRNSSMSRTMRAGNMGSTRTMRSELSLKAATMAPPEDPRSALGPLRNRALKYSARAVSTHRWARISTRPAEDGAASMPSSTGSGLPWSENVSETPLLVPPPEVGGAPYGEGGGGALAIPPVIADDPGGPAWGASSWTRNTQSMCSSSSSSSLMSRKNSSSSAAASGGSGFLRFRTMMVSPRCSCTDSGVSSFSRGLTK
mmetsp:Transcript_4296/g.9071  ORF Transcript_4296/g.9071 Transcript_4296/m.9071 type:complete len:250 (-) Transcript_4296:206-955(-)